VNADGNVRISAPEVVRLKNRLALAAFCNKLFKKVDFAKQNNKDFR
jgi:hypothetical protein